MTDEQTVQATDNGNGAAKTDDIAAVTARPTFDVGAVVAADPLDAGLIQPVVARIAELNRRLGELTQQYEVNKLGLLQQIGAQDREYQTVVRSLAEKYQLITEGQPATWNFDPKQMTFQRNV